MYYHATVKSNTLPLNNSGTRIIIVLLVFVSFFLHTILISELNKLTSRMIIISLGTWYFCNIRYFLLNIIFVQCVETLSG